MLEPHNYYPELRYQTNSSLNAHESHNSSQKSACIFGIPCVTPLLPRFSPELFMLREWFDSCPSRVHHGNIKDYSVWCFISKERQDACKSPAECIVCTLSPAYENHDLTHCICKCPQSTSFIGDICKTHARAPAECIVCMLSPAYENHDLTHCICKCPQSTSFIGDIWSKTIRRMLHWQANAKTHTSAPAECIACMLYKCPQSTSFLGSDLKISHGNMWAMPQWSKTSKHIDIISKSNIQIWMSPCMYIRQNFQDNQVHNQECNLSKKIHIWISTSRQNIPDNQVYNQECTLSKSNAGHDCQNLSQSYHPLTNAALGILKLTGSCLTESCGRQLKNSLWAQQIRSSICMQIISTQLSTSHHPSHAQKYLSGNALENYLCS